MLFIVVYFEGFLFIYLFISIILCFGLNGRFGKNENCLPLQASNPGLCSLQCCSYID